MVAERWCGAWEAEAALRGLARDGDYWEAGKRWIDAQCAARKRPPNYDVEIVFGEPIRFDADADPVAATSQLEEAVRAL